MTRIKNIEDYAQALIQQASDKQASDIHILPEGDDYLIYIRLSTGLDLYQKLKPDQGQRLIAYYKYLADMDVGEHRRPQSGSAQVSLEEGAIDLRFSTMTNFHSMESVVIRLLQAEAQFDLRAHCFFPQLVDQLEELVDRQSGLVLFSGPVGSGKMTTIYQLLRQLNHKRDKNIICIEDPVEIEERHFLQLNVNPKAGISYEKLVRQSLRHHPDVMMIGEIRDEQTAQAVIRAALTGHLILASVHAKNAEGVLSRLIDLGVSEFLLEQVINGVVFQKLLPVYCKQCGRLSSKDCQHYSPDKKRSVLFDIRPNYDSINQPEGKVDFNCWLERALEQNAINQDTYHHYAIH